MVSFPDRAIPRERPAPVVISALKPGDVIQHLGTGEGYVVTANYGDHAIAVRTLHVSNPAEWGMVSSSSDTPTVQIEVGNEAEGIAEQIAAFVEYRIAERLRRDIVRRA